MNMNEVLNQAIQGLNTQGISLVPTAEYEKIRYENNDLRHRVATLEKALTDSMNEAANTVRAANAARDAATRKHEKLRDDYNLLGANYGHVMTENRQLRDQLAMYTEQLQEANATLEKANKCLGEADAALRQGAMAETHLKSAEKALQEKELALSEARRLANLHKGAADVWKKKLDEATQELFEAHRVIEQKDMELREARACQRDGVLVPADHIKTMTNKITRLENDNETLTKTVRSKDAIIAQLRHELSNLTVDDHTRLCEQKASERKTQVINEQLVTLNVQHNRIEELANSLRERDERLKGLNDFYCRLMDAVKAKKEFRLIHHTDAFGNDRLEIYFVPDTLNPNRRAPNEADKDYLNRLRGHFHD